MIVGGIEILALTVVFMLGAIGLVRGPAKELGVTMALVVMLAILTQLNAVFEPQEISAKVNNVMASVGFGTDDATKRDTMVVFLFSAVTVVTAFLAYHGQDTLAFKFKNPPGLVGVVLGWFAGALNGYLIFGTIWSYLERFDYPIQRYEWFRYEFSDLAMNMVRFLPQNIANGIVLSALALALLWWRILR
jgi:uncharacterized membrane protein required for colicin V production